VSFLVSTNARISMSKPVRATPVLLIGCGRMGGAVLEGWLGARAFAPADVLVAAPRPNVVARAAEYEGAVLNPGPDLLAQAQTVVLAVKPQVWRTVAEEFRDRLWPEAVIVSVAVGVRADDISEVFGGRRAARVMPTTGVAGGKGVASIYAADAEARERAHRLFDPIATTVDIEREDLMDVAAATSGSAPAYLYAFTEALAAAGAELGLEPQAALKLATATMVSAAARMDGSASSLAELRAEVASPGGTTEAALRVLMGEEGFGPLMRKALAAAVKRAEELR
jgi:pyrroline-5-carboxylate reductase